MVSVTLDDSRTCHVEDIMQSVPATIGGSRVLFESVEVAPPASVDPYGTSQTTTKARDIRDAYEQLKGVIQDVSDDLGHALDRQGSNRPSSVEITFGLAFSGEANAWVFKSSGEVSLSATLTWTSSSPSSSSSSSS